jgi:hypothetical protein
LTERRIGGFAQSYRALFGLKPDAPTPVHEVDWHLVLNPDAKGSAFVEKKDAVAIHRQMQANTWPGQLVFISDRMDDARITQPLKFGSNRSRLIRTLLNDSEHRDKVKAAMTPDEWLMLVTWIDHNANYHGTVFDVSLYTKTGKFTGVPYDLPDPWIPTDWNPSFFNRADNSHPPVAATPNP